MEPKKKKLIEPTESPALTGGETNSTENIEKEETGAPELALPRWSVVTFEGVAISNLSFEEAQKWMEKLHQQKISGLCIVTDEAAARLSK